MKAIDFAVLIGCGLLLASCGGPDEPVESPTPVVTESSVWFSEEGQDRGVDFQLDVRETGRFAIPEIMTGGIAMFDMEGDGDLDLYMVQTGPLADIDRSGELPTNRLYENIGEGRYSDATAESGADDDGYGVGVAAGDFDGDGHVDLYVTNLGANVLLRNLGDGTFKDVSQASGTDDSGFGSSAAFVDIDQDGDLDLYVCNYLEWDWSIETGCVNELGQPDFCSPNSYDAPAADVLLMNQGDGTFVDISESSGIGSLRGNGLGVVAGDVNADGYPDLFVANDKMPDRLWINNGTRVFTDEGMNRGCATGGDGNAKAGMGVDCVDLDDDGDLDLLVGNLVRETDTLFLNDNGYFQDTTARRGLAALSRQYTRFGLGFADFDHDGRLDLYEANGRVMWQADNYSENDPYAEPNLVLRQNAKGRFQSIETADGTSKPLSRTSRGAAFGDIDNDGDLDVVVVNRNAPVSIYINVAKKEAQSLILDVIDTHGGPAIGAAVSVTLPDGRRLRREVRSAHSYCSASDSRVHVGGVTGPATVHVQWPDGTEQIFMDVLPGAARRLVR
jgi:hypothetical protein